MPWIWSCHRCHTRYLLGATRRCLQDGHYFCGGITVDKISGKVKKHRACLSEFDYNGWEDFGRWKRATSRELVRSGSKHCEDKCNFPSSCHWKEQYVVDETDSGLLDPSCLDIEPDTSSVKDTLKNQQSTESYMGRLKTAAERTMQVAKALLPPIEEEDQKAPSSLSTTPKMNGLGLHSPVMHFSSSENGVKKSCELVDKEQINLSMPKSPQMSARVDNVWEDDVDMTDWITQDASSSPTISPCAQPDAAHVSFDFRLEQNEDPPASPAHEDSPISPTRSIWDWTAGGIGIALSPPVLSVEEEVWEEQMEDEMDGINLLRDGEGTMKPERVDRRLVS